MAKKMTKKAARNAVDESFNRVGRGIAIPVLNLGKIMDAGLAAIEAGMDLDTAVSAAIDKFKA